MTKISGNLRFIHLTDRSINTSHLGGSIKAKKRFGFGGGLLFSPSMASLDKSDEMPPEKETDMAFDIKNADYLFKKDKTLSIIKQKFKFEGVGISLVDF